MKRATVLCVVVVAASAFGDEAADLERALKLTQQIYERVTYIQDTPLYVKTPAETMFDGGDCADMSGLLINFLEAEGIQATMQTMRLLKAPRGQEYHAVVLVHGIIFDPTVGQELGIVFPRPHIILRTITSQRILADWSR